MAFRLKAKLLTRFIVSILLLALERIPLSSVGFPGGSEVKVSAWNAGDLGLIPGSERFPGEGNGNPLQYSLPGESHGGRTLVGYSPWGRKESDTTEWLHFHLKSQTGLSNWTEWVWSGILLWLRFAFPLWIMTLNIFSFTYWLFAYVLASFFFKGGKVNVWTHLWVFFVISSFPTPV